MPYKSDQQRKWAHTEAGKKALGGEAAVHEWDEASKGKDLPKYAKSERLAKSNTSVKIPRQKHMPGPGAKPSVFFKNEEGGPKHPSVQKLSDFLASVKLKKCGQ
jgi:hypothetical protein